MFVRYAKARYDEFRRAETYRIYVTDSLKTLIGANVRYIDLLNQIKKTQKDTRSGEEIVADVIKRAGLVVM